MKVHFIAIGGSAMHNLALALHYKGYKITGSDDEIFDPAKSRLEREGLLPEKEGWFPEKITTDLDAVILGMHARIDNPELLKAKELGLRIFSYPEYLYEQSKDKIRVVIGGSHGKTSITAMILHALQYHSMETDYMVGAQLAGFDVMVKLSESAPVIILEGDEYLTSPIDRRPKFHLYKPHIALVSGIAWDHVNVFPTFEIYVEQFSIFVDSIVQNGKFVYYSGDEEVVKIATKTRKDVEKFPYSVPAYSIHNGTTFIKYQDNDIPLWVFGKHNLENIEGARKVCNALGVDDKGFYEAIQSFKGASKRLELVKKNAHTAIYKDFAHSPSKLKATIVAMKEQYPDRELVACMELHTFSSLTKEFLKQYEGSMSQADTPIVYFNPHTISHKKLPALSEEQIVESFDLPGLKIFTDSRSLKIFLKEINWNNKNLLMMSSGNYDGINFEELADELI